MQCVQCGADLRPGAKFCNVCGVRQPGAPVGVTAGTTAIADEHAGGGETETAETGGRARRPARVPRVRDGETIEDAEDVPEASRSDAADAPEAADGADGHEHPYATGLLDPADLPHADTPGDAADTATDTAAGDAVDSTEDTPADEAEDALSVPPEFPPDFLAADEDAAPTATRLPSPTIPVSEEDRAAIAAHADEMTAELADDAHDTNIADEETQEVATILGVLAAPGDSGALPWPLPTQMIVGGRYRVESVLPMEHDDENAYLVLDLQGYERCWSCGAEHGAEASEERYCRDCGADTLGREYVLTERALAPDEPQPETTFTADRRTFTQAGRSFVVVPREEGAPVFPHGVRLVVASATDVGQTRQGTENQDSNGSFVLALPYGSDGPSSGSPLALCVVADGLGGHTNGQAASRRVVRTLLAAVLRHATVTAVGLPDDSLALETGPEHILRAAVAAANDELLTLNRDPDEDMGSTVVAALIVGETAYIANVGDSRAYVLEGGELRRITTDHSLVEQLIGAGLLTPEERYTHPKRNQIFRSLGGDDELEVDVFTQRLRPGVRLLLCSDGLWEMVRDDEAARILRETVDVQTACDLLVRAANTNGGVDNITALVVEARG